MKITLAAARVNKQYTQQEVAKMLGVTARTISNWESGKVSPKLAILKALALIYGCESEDFLCNKNSV